jgi:hypothetical protein
MSKSWPRDSNHNASGKPGAVQADVADRAGQGGGLQGHLVGDDGRRSAVIALGYETGGHRGMFLDCKRNRAVALQIGTMALVANRKQPVVQLCQHLFAIDAFSFVVSGDGRSAHRIEGHVVTQRGEKHFIPPRVRARRTGLSAKHDFVRC